MCPFWGVYFLLALWPWQAGSDARAAVALAPLIGGRCCCCCIASRHQAGVGETQAFFARLDPAQEKLQRMRANYVWVSIWGPLWIGHWTAMYALGLAAYVRVRRAVPVDLRFFLLGLPAVGILSMPGSWLLLEKAKWALLPQFQPMRALLFVTAVAGIVCSVAGVKAALAGRWWEAGLWLLIPYSIPVHAKITQLPAWPRVEVIITLALAAAVSVWSMRRWKAAAHGAIAATALAAFWLIPGWGRVVNYPHAHSAELDQLAGWARASTPKDAVFLFPDAGKEGYPGIFRAEAQRAVYVDWKGGGQVNYLKELGEEWWRRWQAGMAPGYKPDNWARYRELGVQYVVLKAAHREVGVGVVWENRAWVVYRVVG